jgi:hypothetical protein
MMSDKTTPTREARLEAALREAIDVLDGCAGDPMLDGYRDVDKKLKRIIRHGRAALKGKPRDA